MKTFLENIALYKKLTGNEVRLILFCYEKEYRQCKSIHKYIDVLRDINKKEREAGYITK